MQYKETNAISNNKRIGLIHNITHIQAYITTIDNSSGINHMWVSVFVIFTFGFSIL